MNENYLLFLASLIEYHFNDVQALTTFVTSSLLQGAAESDPAPGRQRQSTNILELEPIDEQSLTELCKESVFFKSTLHTEQHLGQDVVQNIKIKVDTVELEWVFGLGFDDHEENFVTLNNRNFSKLILD